MPVTPLRPSDPTSMGPYRLLTRLGQGGMGTVYLGVSPDEQAVAVKVLRDGVADPLARRRFRSELEALRRVRSPHLVEVLDADVEADTPYLVTRFVAGQRLDEQVAAEGPLAADELCRLARGLADALADLHDAAIIHRDLNPSNVLVVDGQPQVIDLGLATAADVVALTRSLHLLGTPGYVAPEQVVGSVVSPAVDVHAWGATVAFAGTGRPPYGTGRVDAVLYRIVHAAPDLDGLPPPLDRLVSAALDPDPARRPSARDLLDRLGGASAAEPVSLHLAHDVDPASLLETDILTPASGFLSSADDWGPAPEDPAGPAGRGAGHPAYGMDLLPDDPPAPVRLSAIRRLQIILTAAAAVGVVAGATVAAPVTGATLVLLLLVTLRAVGRSTERLRDRRERRGERRRDRTVSTLGAPWHLLLGLRDTAASLPVLAALAVPTAGVVWLADPQVSGLQAPEMSAATAAAVCLVVALSRKEHQGSRHLLGSALVRATRGPISAGALVVALIAVAGLLLATAEGAEPSLWPVDRLRS